MDIREAQLGDAERIQALSVQLGYTPSLSEIKENIAHFLIAKDDAVFVAEMCGYVVGMIAVNVVKMLHDVEPLGKVSTLVIDDNFRDMTIGRSLLNYAEDYLHLRGCLKIEVTSANSRHEAHGFYLHLGYRITPERFIKFLAYESMANAS